VILQLLYVIKPQLILIVNGKGPENDVFDEEDDIDIDDEFEEEEENELFNYNDNISE
jgi:hypothetical protein